MSLEENLNLFSPEECVLVEQLLAVDQGHLFEDWDRAGVNDGAKKNFVSGLAVMDASYPGGLRGYIENARVLLAEAREGKNPFEGFIPHRPDMVDLSVFGQEYDEYEAIALNNLDKMAVVLVAGGLGERLGYAGIKLDIPIEVMEDTSYLAHYASVLKAMEDRMPEPRPVPFIIMTSRDTNERTVESLEKNDYFGLSRSQVRILKQELVPAVSDNAGHLALEEKYSIVTKPHGHGDIHMLLHSSGVARELYDDGITHLLFIQDTNGQVFNAGLTAVAVSMKQGYDFNSVAVNRIPGEAAGGLTRLVKDGQELTLNVEYNQLDPLLRATISPEGDVPNENGYSIFPGNINVLVVKLESYVRILERTSGIIAEFVNPKYADVERTKFKKPTRLETMMQDLPKLFGPDERPGVTVFDRKWCFSADKNNIVDAKAKHEAGGPPESAATAESDFYLAGRMKCREAGMEVIDNGEELIRGIPFTNGPKIVLKPSFALTLKEVRQKIRGGSISGEAALILNGRDIELENVELSGRSALVVNAVDGARVTVRGGFANDGYELVRLSDEEMRNPVVPEYLKIRGYRMENRGARICTFDQPGEYVVEE